MTTLDTTTNNDFRYPTGANDGTDFATGLQDFADDVDGMWSSGTLAARPAAGTLNRVYWATDTKLLYQDNGSAWTTVLLAGAWVALTLGTGVASSGYTASARPEGDLTRLRGALANGTGSSIASGVALATVSSALRPSTGLIFPGYINGSSDSPTEIRISGSGATAGQISLDTALPAGAIVGLNSITFTLS
jgi:hypothetical protein